MDKFFGDSIAGADDRLIDAIKDANPNWSPTLGLDNESKKFDQFLKGFFGQDDIHPFFVYNGTAGNVLGINAICDSCDSVITTEKSHLYLNECAALEVNTGIRMFTVPTVDGKLDSYKVQDYLRCEDDLHYNYPKVISIAQPTEFGTVYSVEELRHLRQFADENNLLIHLDGARLANALVSLDLDFREFFKIFKPDVLTLSGTKNGIVFGDLLVFFDKKHTRNFTKVRMQRLQSYNKVYFIVAQYKRFFEDGIWKENAENANKQAKALEKMISEEVKDISILQPVESNLILVKLPSRIVDRIESRYYNYNMDKSIFRLMTSFNTTEYEIRDFIQELK